MPPDPMGAHWTSDGPEPGWAHHVMSCSLPPSWDRWNAAARWDFFLVLLATLLDSLELYEGVGRSTPLELTAWTGPAPAAPLPPILNLIAWWEKNTVVPWSLSIREVMP